jgi:hypothetical protein
VVGTRPSSVGFVWLDHHGELIGLHCTKPFPRNPSWDCLSSLPAHHYITTCPRR